MRHKHQSILDNERLKEENVDQTKLENEVSQIRKRELLKLKMQDMKEQYGEVQDFQKQRREKIIKKHLSLNRNVIQLRET